MPCSLRGVRYGCHSMSHCSGPRLATPSRVALRVFCKVLLNGHEGAATVQNEHSASMSCFCVWRSCVTRLAGPSIRPQLCQPTLALEHLTAYPDTCASSATGQWCIEPSTGALNLPLDLPLDLPVAMHITHGAPLALVLMTPAVCQRSALKHSNEGY